MIIKKSNKAILFKIITLVFFISLILIALKSYNNIEKAKLKEIVYLNENVEKGTKISDLEISLVKVKQLDKTSITNEEFTKMLNDKTSKYIINHNMIEDESLSVTDISTTESVYLKGNVLYVIPTKFIEISQAVRPQDLLMLIMREKHAEETQETSINQNRYKNNAEVTEEIVTVEYIKNTKGQKIYDVREIQGRSEEIKVEFRENNSDNIGLVEVSSNIETAKNITDKISSGDYTITTLVIPYGSEEYTKIKKEQTNENIN